MASPEWSAVVVRVAAGADPARVSSIMASWGDVTVFSKAGQEDLLVQGMVDKCFRRYGERGTCLACQRNLSSWHNGQRGDNQSRRT